jgi:hypothetical protein
MSLEHPHRLLVAADRQWERGNPCHLPLWERSKQAHPPPPPGGRAGGGVGGGGGGGLSFDGCMGQGLFTPVLAVQRGLREALVVFSHTRAFHCFRAAQWACRMGEFGGQHGGGEKVSLLEALSGGRLPAHCVNFHAEGRCCPSQAGLGADVGGGSLEPAAAGNEVAVTSNAEREASPSPKAAETAAPISKKQQKKLLKVQRCAGNTGTKCMCPRASSCSAT